MKNSFLILAFFATVMLASSCSKTADVAPKPSLVGVWKYKSARIPYDDASGKTLTVDVAPKAGTGIEFKASGAYVITGSNQPFVVTKLNQTQTLQISSSTYSISTVDEIAAAFNSGTTFTPAEKKENDAAIAAIKKEGINYVVTLGDFEIISKSSAISTFTISWDWFSIKSITANQLVLEFFPDNSPVAERLQIILEK
jgi:hypothetical protein